MTRAMLVWTTICIAITAFFVLESRIFEYISADSIHTFFFSITDSGSISARNSVEESDPAYSVVTSIAWTFEIVICSEPRIETTNICYYFRCSALLSQCPITFLLLHLKTQWWADHLFWSMFFGNTFSFDTSLSWRTTDSGTCLIRLNTSTIEATESRFALDSKAFTDIGGQVTFLMSLEPFPCGTSACVPSSQQRNGY